MPIDPLHSSSRPGTAWTTANAAENIPGLMTPLGATFWLEVVELGLRGAFGALGVLPASEVTTDLAPDDRLTTVFCGRFVVNVDTFRHVSDLTPGASGAEFEESLLGSVRDLPVARLAPWRYGLVATRAPLVATLLPGRVRDTAEEVRGWWTDVTVGPGRDTPARERLLAAYSRALPVMRVQLLATFLAQGMFDRLEQLAAKAGRPEDFLSLMTGYGDTEEVVMVALLYKLAHGEITLAAFLERYGARCPGENELSARSWREDPTPVATLARKYKDATAIPDPATQNHKREAERADAEARILAALKPAQRRGAGLLFRLGRTFIPLREQNKGTLAMTMDAARCAARDLGAELAAAGTLADADDVFYLTLDELAGARPADVPGVVAERRATRAEYERFDLPQFWTGAPVPIEIVPLDESGERVTELEGMAASSGVAEGRVIVLNDADGIDDIEPGDILVCRTTDPSWASAFHLVSGTVIDIGGPVSHGAIVSREMGIPCVINTREGTRVLRTGDTVRVDGSAGRVTVLTPVA